MARVRISVGVRPPCRVDLDGHWANHQINICFWRRTLVEECGPPALGVQSWDDFVTYVKPQYGSALENPID